MKNSKKEVQLAEITKTPADSKIQMTNSKNKSTCKLAFNTPPGVRI